MHVSAMTHRSGREKGLFLDNLRDREQTLYSEGLVRGWRLVRQRTCLRQRSV